MLVVYAVEPTELELGGESDDDDAGGSGDNGGNDSAVDPANMFAFAETGKPLAATHVAAFTYGAVLPGNFDISSIIFDIFTHFSALFHPTRAVLPPHTRLVACPTKRPC